MAETKPSGTHRTTNTDILGRLDKLETEVEARVKEIETEVKEHVTDFEKRTMHIEEKLDRLILLIDGDPSKDVPGIRKQIKDLDADTKKLSNERNMIKWILVGVAITGITNAASAITILSRVFATLP